jgi:glycosyltransferase involved in cell wall biosynthesis
MKIVWFSWKDHAHPARGGAEVVKAEFARRLAKEGHELIIITARYEGSEPTSNHDGYHIVRIGGRCGVYWQAYRYYKQNLRGWADLVIDEVNTIPFFATYYAGVPTVLFIHQLARKIWFFEMRFPLSLVGYVLEPLYLRLLSGMPAITVSESSQKDLLRHGFRKDRVHIVPEGLHIQPVKDLAATKKAAHPTLLIHGCLRAMKRPLDVVKAFEIAKKDIPDLRLEISGQPSGAYGQKVAGYIAESPYRRDITLHGRTTDAAKIRLMRRAHFIVVTSVKEGWGLIISEAASQGAPAIVYDVDGLRDAVGFGRYGLIAPEQSIPSLAATITRGFGPRTHYARMRKDAYTFASKLTFDAAYRAFVKIITAQKQGK